MDLLPRFSDDLSLRRPGQGPREEARRARREAPLWTAVARLLNVHTDERAWRLGADGEERVGATLDRLARRDPRWRVLHSVLVGSQGTDIDHIVIGPGGVFTVNTKHHPQGKLWVGGDTFMVNGVRTPYIRAARAEAKGASRRLGVPVTGVVVAVNPARFTVKTPPADVQILEHRALKRWLRSLPDVLEPEEVTRVYNLARQHSTWIHSPMAGRGQALLFE